MVKTRRRNQDTTAKLGFEAQLWAAADALRNNMDAAEYKHVVLGLIFLKYISDAFEGKHAQLEAQRARGVSDLRSAPTSTCRLCVGSTCQQCGTCNGDQHNRLARIWAATRLRHWSSRQTT